MAEVDVVVAIDGPAGAGKSTVARAVADRAGLRYLDSGSLYRAATLAVLRAGVDPADGAGVAALVGSADLRLALAKDGRTLEVRLAGERPGERLRDPAVNAAVSAVAALRPVRGKMLGIQRAAIGGGGIVVEGRDIGTVVWPSAAVKVFLVADPVERARRRGGGVPGAESPAAVARRDRLDAGRELAPTAAAPDATLLDSTDRSVDEVVAEVLRLLERARAGRPVAGGAPAGAPTGRAAANAGPTNDQPRLAEARWVRLLRALRPTAGRGRQPNWWYTGAGWAIKPSMRWWFRLDVRGAEHIPSSGPAILASNHRSNMDPVLLPSGVRRRLSFMAKVELFRGPLGFALTKIGMFPVRRGGLDREALRDASAVLERGGVLGIFPEGTRGQGDFTEILPGVAYMVLRHRVPVIPVVLLGTEHIREPGGWRPRRQRIRIVIGPALDLPAQRPGHEGRRAATDALHAGLRRWYDVVTGSRARAGA